MASLTRQVAVCLYYRTLMFSRRPDIRRAIRHRWIGRLPLEKQPAAARSLARQNRFARRIGLPMMTVIVNLFVVSIFLTIGYRLVLELYERGLLTPPDSVREAADNREAGFVIRPKRSSQK